MAGVQEDDVHSWEVDDDSRDNERKEYKVF
jgi:hypothetical protein